MKFAYWVAFCKSKGCFACHVAKFIGQHDGRPVYFLPDEMPGWFDFECGDCHTIHRYTRDDLEVEVLDVPPPPGFPEWW
jgi:hypothetical protein